MKLYMKKLDWILPHVEDKRVLDLGCVCHDLGAVEMTDWLHGRIRERAREVVGVDYLESEVQVLRERGFDVECANVETMDLGRKFEVVVAGDLIEHVNNFGMFLERVRDHLEDGGEFLVTTPNPINLLRFLRTLATGSAGANEEHTSWFTVEVLAELLRRFGFTIDEVAWIDDSSLHYPKIRWKPFLLTNSLLCRFRPQFAETFGLAVAHKPIAV